MCRLAILLNIKRTTKLSKERGSNATMSVNDKESTKNEILWAKIAKVFHSLRL
jgi:hypothetical protein